MRVAVQNPGFLFADQTRNFDGYNFEFVRQFKPVIFLPGWRARLRGSAKWRHAMKRCGLESEEFEFVYSLHDLRRRADVLLCFNQGACLPGNQPPAAFPGMKVWHVMDFNYRTSDCYLSLVKGRVDYVMAYTDLGRHCGFFQRYYPEYAQRVIAVPFGFGERFQNRRAFERRIQKVVAMGAINPVNQDETSSTPVLREYAEFYREYEFSQMWRRRLAENADLLRDVLDSFLPIYPQINRRIDSPVDILNQYALFANDESVCGFPPARTYEGTASGAAMVSSNHECFRELGFEDGVNCLMHKPMHLAEFREKVSFYLARPEMLRQIAQRGCAMVRERYTHAAVARKLYADLEQRWANKPH